MGEPIDGKAAKDAAIKSMATSAADWTDDEFAGRIVGLLIHDEGNLNKYKRTIELMIEVCRERDRIIVGRAALAQEGGGDGK